MTAMDTQSAAMEAATPSALIERVEKMASESGAKFAELMAPYLEEQEGGEPYDEEFEDTLERKYQEGFSEAASLILDLLKKNLPEIEKNIQQQEGCDVLSYLSDLFEGVEDTDIWGDYFGEGSN